MNRESRRAGRAVVVTGCSSGIGRAVAIRLARAGYSVFATVRREEHRRELEGLGLPGLVVLCPVDLASEEEISAATARLGEALEASGAHLYAIVNNAGGGGPAPVELVDTAVMRTETLARIVGPIALLKGTLPLLRRGGGRVVWITTPALIPTPYVASIHACDFAVNCLARTLDIELARWRIPNVMVRCGGIKTRAGMRTTADVDELLRRASPEQRELYGAALAKWGREMGEFDRRRSEPELVAERVLRALDAPRPKGRYPVGHMARFASVLEALPQGLADSILRRRFAG